MLPIEFLLSECSKFGLVLDEIAIRQFNQYYDILIDWNKKINLTALIEPEEVAEKHFLDSLIVLKYCKIPENAKIIDVGSGAGFPGIILKIARPDIELTLLDSLNKRVVFLNQLAKKLGISVNTLHMRAEDGGNTENLREAFDIATARAVANLSVLSEYCLPFVKADGNLICLKGPDPEDELSEANTAITLLGGGTSTIFKYNLPSGDGRSIIYVKKISQTPPKYPRQGVKISKKPLK